MTEHSDADATRSWRSIPQLFHALGLKAKLLITILPFLAIILAGTGYAMYKVSTEYMDIALERNVRIRDLALAHAVEDHLDQCRRDLLLLSRLSLTPESMPAAFAALQESSSIDYCEFGYIAPNAGQHIFFVTHAGKPHPVPGAAIADIRPSPFRHLDDLPPLRNGEVHPSPILDVEYPLPLPQNTGHRVGERIIRFTTPFTAKGSTSPGHLCLGIRARDLRNLLSLYNSRRSPIWGYPRSDEVRFSYLFDPTGWILFQSDQLDKPNAELGTFLARSGYTGTLGRPGLPCAFRPGTAHADYWNMVMDAAEGRDGILRLRDDGHTSKEVNSYYLSWAPIRFRMSPNKPPMVYAGATFVDRSRLTVTAGYEYIDVMLLITLGSTLLLSLLVYLMSRLSMGPIYRLTKAVSAMQTSGRLQRLTLPESGYETGRLQAAINGMIDRVRDQMEQIRQRDEAIEHVNLKEPARLEGDTALLEEVLQGDMPDIVGVGPRMALFKSDIARAAQVDVDVLVMGETGTGKQLVAEAVHRQSRRAERPFISINCGALDENLLLDALFGHVKGAFSEARSDRKGAFQEADGGTLFLDEIQSASAKVQQALLRAIAMRKIKPLGRDMEVDVDVRLICATNANLAQMIQDRDFREDLYYRLKVLTIQTPPLREHPESIPLLALHYLRQAELLVNRSGMSLSKGAVRKMTGYHWPGNIRELINSITRAAVMAETEVIQAEEIKLEIEGLRYVSPLDQDAIGGSDPCDDPRGQEAAPLDETNTTPPGQDDAIPGPESSSDAQVQSGDASVDSTKRPDAPPKEMHKSDPGRSRSDAPKPTPPISDGPPELNRRQKRALPVIRKRGVVSRNDYQSIVGGKLASRTAIYDLQDMVKKGLLIKEGRGPATRYVVNPKARRLNG